MRINENQWEIIVFAGFLWKSIAEQAARGPASAAPDVPRMPLPTPVSPGTHRTVGESLIELLLTNYEEFKDL